MSGIRLSKKHGLNPTIALCPYCNEPKNEILLTGSAGDTWAKENGFDELPMYVHVEGDIEPCDKCKENGIAIVEVYSEDDRNLTGNRWLVKEEAVKSFVTGSLLDDILEKRIMIIPIEVSKHIGLRSED